MILHHLSKSDAVSAAMANNQDLIKAIVALTKNSDNPEVTRYAAGTLYNISRHDRGILAIFQSGGIPALVRLLGYVAVCFLKYHLLKVIFSFLFF